MITLQSRVLEFIGSLFYFIERSKAARWAIFFACVVVFGSLVPLHQKRIEDTTLYPMPAVYIRASMVNRYVRTTGKLLLEGAYDVQTTDNGLFGHTMRFVPFLTPNTREPLMVLQENLPNPDANGDVTLVGKMMLGDEDKPQYFLQVMEPPNKVLYDALFWLCVGILFGFAIGVYLAWLARKADYALSMPFGVADDKLANTSMSHYLLWSGGLGAGYGDIVLRQSPIAFRAIPSEARLTPVSHPDSWSVTIVHLRHLQMIAVATRYGALPSLRIEFEDERGMTRNGVIAASHQKLIDSMLDVMQFVGQ